MHYKCNTNINCSYLKLLSHDMPVSKPETFYSISTLYMIKVEYQKYNKTPILISEQFVWTTIEYIL